MKRGIMEKNYIIETYSLDPKVIKQRQKTYMEQLQSYFVGAKEITIIEYKQIRNDFNNGDMSALSRLVEKSIYNLIISISKLYAKYDIEKYLRIDEAFSYVYEKFDKYVMKFNKLPRYRTEFTDSTINFFVYRN